MLEPIAPLLRFRFRFRTPAPGPSHDVCNGQQGTDFAVVGTCEQENQIELTGPFPET